MSMLDRLPTFSEPSDLLDPKWVTCHRGDLADFLARHRRQAKRVIKEGRSALATIAPALLFRVAHDKTLRAAWNYLREHGGQAPGPDGLRYDDLTEPEVWKLLRGVRDEIRAGEYLPDNERVCWISKGAGRGKRPLVVQSIIDRVVQRAAVEIIQPLVDPLFDPRSFGFRPKRSPLQALAVAEHLFTAERRRVWLTVDVKDAFSRVPLPRLLAIVRKYLVADDLVEFLGVVIRGASQPGLRQGGALSPLFLNVYLHHCLDRRWRQRHPSIPLLRYADDILLLCHSAAQARATYPILADLLRAAGMLLKESCDEGVRTLTGDEPAKWMGFRIDRDDNRLRFGLTEESWGKLDERVAFTHHEPDSPVRAYQVIVGWVAQKGPCYPFLDHAAAADRIAAVAHRHGFDEIPGRGEVRRLWQRAHARWAKVRAWAASGTAPGS